MSLIGIESKISDGKLTGLLTNEHCITKELIVEPTGTKVDEIDLFVVDCADMGHVYPIDDDAR